MNRDPKESPTPPSSKPAERPPGAPRPDRPQAGKPAGAPPSAHAPSPKSAVKFTRMSAAWWAVILGSLFLIVLLVFIAQNTEAIEVRFLGWEWHSPLGVAFLASAVCGALITVLIAAARMIQLRRAANKNLRAR